MIKTRHTWIIFGFCAVLVLAAMGWASLNVLRLDRQQAEARRAAELEERVRLALWRMDSALAPLIYKEQARPYFSYSAFYPAERAYTRMFAKIEKGDVLIPSPLLTQVSPYILLHFQFSPDGRLTSPQVPAGNMQDLAETGYITHEQLAASARRLENLRKILTRDKLFAALDAYESRIEASLSPPIIAERDDETGQIARQKFRNVAEWQKRTQTYKQQAEFQQSQIKAPLLSPEKINEGAMHPVWIEDELILARNVTVNGRRYVQGCRLNWNEIRKWLLSSIEDLLPQAQLTPLKSGPEQAESRMLVALPVRIVAGAIESDAGRSISPVKLSLIIAGICVIAAAGAVAVLLLGAISLSERRATFVSSVTHELRTPLTTFRMYTEMLAEGMVPDEKKRGEYLKTLQAEADRLDHMVKNVLAYSRVERGKVPGRMESVTLGELVQKLKDRLAARAEQARMDLIVEHSAEAESTSVHVDTSIVEQILFNLVDNACKYANSATDRRIHLEPGFAGKHAFIKVRDHGPGVPEDYARRLFQPFSRPDVTMPPGSATGVGLGLALCRRLARQMGCELTLDKSAQEGACFILRLPFSV